MSNQHENCNRHHKIVYIRHEHVYNHHSNFSKTNTDTSATKTETSVITMNSCKNNILISPTITGTTITMHHGNLSIHPLEVYNHHGNMYNRKFDVSN
ncbi:hypothetical protein DPMN_138578 [Dreissena polymorpha]|uniref:Uncharacterized protein n=1 Tax=Dreissena polymorpha TaxID=45954 RepID=A0A9D4G440_DREPO|nr:hypothetical protein DPMN_138578 [Dreissena polymorpha]